MKINKWDVLKQVRKASVRSGQIIPQKKKISRQVEKIALKAYLKLEA